MFIGPPDRGTFANRSMKTLSFELKPVPPFRLDLTVWALRRRSENLVDQWDGSTYRRVLIQSAPAEVAVNQEGTAESPVLHVTITGSRLPRGSASKFAEVLQKTFGLCIPLDEFYKFAAREKNLKALAERFRGVKPPRFPSLYEALVNGVSCQQLSLTVGIILQNRLAQNYGLPFSRNGDIFYSFALPERVARSNVPKLRQLGFSRQKAEALLDLSGKIAGEQINLQQYESLADDVLLEKLYQLRGVGRWTGEYALLRGLGRIHIFPGDDVGAKNKLRTLLRLKQPPDYEAVKRLREKWKPFAGFIYFHLLLDGLADRGLLKV